MIKIANTGTVPVVGGFFFSIFKVFFIISKYA